MIAVGGPKTASEDLAPLADHPELERLQITGTVDLSDQVFAFLSQTDQLVSINLQGNRITDEGLLRLPPLSQVHSLHLASTQSTGGVLKRLRGSPLQDVSFARLTDKGAAGLREFPSLVRLNLRGSPIGSAGLQCLAPLRLLESLQLSQCRNLQDGDFTLLRDLPRLSTLDLQQTAAGDQAIAALRGLNSLRDLKIGSDALSDHGLKMIGDLVSLRTLTLGQESTRITDAGFADFWRLVNLEQLSIAGPAVSGQGFGPLAELPQLRRLYLNHRRWHGAAAQHLADMPKLTELSIGDRSAGGPNGFTDQSLLELAESRSLKKLTLYRQGTSVSEEAVMQLRTLKPEWKIDVH
jgi:hypothetical protein